MENARHETADETMEVEGAPDITALEPVECHGKSDSSEFPCASHRSGSNVVLTAGSSHQLTTGCSVGIPVIAGFLAKALPQGRALFHVALSFAEADDFHALIELARNSITPFEVKRRVGFSVMLRPLTDSVGEAFPRMLKVRGANLLHYAICIGAFNAAAALLVICPEYLQGTCTVCECRADEEYIEEGESWGCSQIAEIFCVLYGQEDGGADIAATGTKYRSARDVLKLGENDPSSLPFLGLHTAAQRVAAATGVPDTVVTALFASASTQPVRERDQHDEDMLGF